MIKLGRTIQAQPTAARSLFLSTLPLPTRVTYAPGSVVEAVRVWLRQLKDKRRKEGPAFGMQCQTNQCAFRRQQTWRWPGHCSCPRDRWCHVSHEILLMA